MPAIGILLRMDPQRAVLTHPQFSTDKAQAARERTDERTRDREGTQEGNTQQARESTRARERYLGSGKLTARVHARACNTQKRKKDCEKEK